MKKIISSIAVMLFLVVCTTANSYAQSERYNPNNAPLITISSNWPFTCSSLSLTVIHVSTYNSSMNITNMMVQDNCGLTFALNAVGNVTSQLTTGSVINIRVTNGTVIVAISVAAN